ncbi:uncharacterized protein LOC131627372 isoform X2 [Vicia villosa]|uniref:uncharacterized protein LOC131627372 isoform X2 n=1 Tax=Vicia villosa TaxID=3911 RepID=UPI00273BFA49|nr:uncharacterized protein LOC131627372 isoform X2 [Vicia villosa]
MLSFICTLLLPPMTGERCYRRKNMAEQASAAVADVEERPSLASFPASLEIDYLSQARKALSERCPFDVAEETSTSTSAAVTLPSGLASLLSRQGDSRKRQKKSHSGGGDKKKKSSRAAEKLRGFDVWAETEECFRDLNLSDIDTLLEASTSYSLASRECYTIPHFGNSPRFNVVSSEDEKKHAPLFNVVSSENEKNVVEEVNNENGSLGIELSDVVELEKALPNDDKNCDASDSCDSLEWFLGSRNRIFLASERPSKKRKLLGGDAGLEKVLMTKSCDGEQPCCHYCGRGDSGTDSNRLIVCASCKVAVHWKCYGIQDDVDESWLCSWCKQKSEVDDSVSPCVLCSKKGGALKPVNSVDEAVESAEFVHLYCCLWMPEVYIDDLKKMEPVMNVGGIKDTRRKLVCNVCKLKCGACVRCSHGSCRTSFHPLCAREARHRMEVWAKYGNDNIELRAFCLKHSDLQEKRNILPLGGSIAVGNEFPKANDLPVTLPVKSEHKVKIGCSNGGLESDTNPDMLNHNDEPPDGGLSVCTVSAQNMLGCGAAPPHNIGVEGRTNENVNASDSPSFALVLKKLIERGKVDVNNVALEIGISPDMLTTNINEGHMAPDVQHKIVNWLKAHVYTGAFHNGLKAKIKPANVSMDESGASDGSDTSPLSDSGLPNPVAVNVKSVPPRRRTISNIRILKDNKVICSSEGVTTSENGVSIDKFLVPECENPGISNKATIPDATETETNITKSDDVFHGVQGNADKPYKPSLSVCVPDQKSTTYLQNASMLSDQHYPAHSASEPPVPGSTKMEAISSYIHPYINKKLHHIRDCLAPEDLIGLSGYRNSLVESSGANSCSSRENQQLICTDVHKPDQVKVKQLVRNKNMQLLEFYSEDELETELLYFQHKLLQRAVAKKSLTENLVYNVAKGLPLEIDKTHQQRWDAVIANQYLLDLREAKKLGRKEKKHKEAQAVLAAATAAAAASSRVSSFRKDTIDESVQHENSFKVDALSGLTGACPQPMPRAKETLSRVAVTRASSEKYSDFSLPNSDFSKEQRKSCDICRRFENMLNPILVCSACKVVVHSVCYRSVKETTGPWFCELCEDLSKSTGASAINSWEKPYFIAECALCGGTTGAFRKSSDGQWVHAFCAEWLFESTFRRGQIDAIEGMETVRKGVDICCVCHRRHGVCMRCCYGHCLTTFHPSCARSAGLFMIVRTAGGKMQHKAYCEKHSSEQRTKAETPKHGVEELKSIKQIRVELERLRLLCERIVKREKIKRELVLCSHDILAFKRDHIARSVLVQSPFLLPDGSSESATTSLKAATEGYRSCSEALQRSDDVTVDSSVSAKHRVRVAVSMDTDPKLDDDCSTSQSQYNHKIPEKMQFSGKQIPRRASATSHNISEEDGWRTKSRKLQTTETFGKELVMTSDEASMKNSRLPKGYAYVPADCLSNDKQSNEDVYASGPGEHDR